MATNMLFINIPVTDLTRSRSFYEALGWKVNDDFTTNDVACIVIEENICLMLLTTDWYRTFTTRPISDTRATTSAAYALSLPSKEAVDEMTDRAVAAGGTEEVNEDKRAQETQVGMHGRSFIDPDGHQWEPFWMDYQPA